MLQGCQSLIAPMDEVSHRFIQAGYRFGHVHRNSHLPVVIQPTTPCHLNSVEDDLRAHILEILLDIGGVLFRGFRVTTPLDLKKFAASFGWPLVDYEFGSTPRMRVFQGIYTSTEYPPHQHIPLHNEQSYTGQWPSHIWFHCLKPSLTGGETPIADSRQVFQRIPPALREEFMARGLLYVRNYGGGLDLPWQKVFNTEDRGEVERYCEQQGIEWEWKADGELRTRQRCQAAIQHPVTGEWTWFNQAHLFHVSALEPAVRASLLQTLDEADLPRNVYFGDGVSIPDAALEQIRAIYQQTAVAFPWQAGDVLMLDNLLVAHGRRPFNGERKVIVAMA